MTRRSILWVGNIDEKSTSERLARLNELIDQDPNEKIDLVVISTGGDAACAFAFYDYVRTHKVNLTTVGSGVVSSAAVVVWLSGQLRMLTPHTLMFLHNVKLNVVKDGLLDPCEISTIGMRGQQLIRMYAQVVAENSNGKLTVGRVEDMMKITAVLNAKEVLRLGMAHEIIKF